jgi:hypothetical protein
MSIHQSKPFFIEIKYKRENSAGQNSAPAIHHSYDARWSDAASPSEGDVES